MKQTITKLASVLVCAMAVVLAGCQKEKDATTVSFEKANEVLDAGQSVDVTVVLSKAAEADVTVPFTATSTSAAEKAFTLSAEEVVIKAGEVSGSVTVTNTGADLEAFNLTLALGNVAGMKKGMNPQIVIAMGALERVIYSFQSPKAKLIENSSVVVNVTISGEKSGSNLITSSDIVLPVELSSADTECQLSSQSIVIPAGSLNGSVTITAPEKFQSETLPVFDLEVKSGDPRFLEGAVSKVSVVCFANSFLDDIVGTWAFSKDLHTQDDDLGMIGMTEAELGQTIPFPQCSANDSFTVSYNESDIEYTFTPSMEGDLKRYFRECSLSNAVATKFRHPVSYVTYSAYLVTFSSVNFDFGTSDSKLQSADVAILVDGDVMDVFLFCDSGIGYKTSFEPHADFGAELESYGMKVWEMMGAIFDLHYQFTKTK